MSFKRKPEAIVGKEPGRQSFQKFWSVKTWMPCQCKTMLKP